ncbi:crossover junction endodeoxyribonuclease RuvC [Niallia taxi]|uniref:crossover junction endodeoxyribonuclease RuvC n=1 Tax=Niallia taxi TaxID=2499688 RepID=UPI0015F531E4|nr:crossover junction endodeoxyribonuclease RuvC [Niallia taxi]
MRFVGIDPSTKTGFVAIAPNGEVLKAKELTGVGSEDPKRMATLIDEVMRHIQPEDFVVIEGFGYSTTQGIQLGGIGWGIRMALLRRRINYIEVAPNALKKFATGKGNSTKEDMVQPLMDRWGFCNSSDNVRDAFVMAHIARNLSVLRDASELEMNMILESYQSEVICNILYPKQKPRKKKQVAK